MKQTIFFIKYLCVIFLAYYGMFVKNLKTNYVILIVVVVTVGAVLIVPAFAIESYPYWYTHEAVPNGSADGGERQARSSASGQNGVYAESNSAYEGRVSTAKNNYKSGYVTDDPTLTT